MVNLLGQKALLYYTKTRQLATRLYYTMTVPLTPIGLLWHPHASLYLHTCCV
jgi:hypothetical protein